MFRNPSQRGMLKDYTLIYKRQVLGNTQISITEGLVINFSIDPLCSCKKEGLPVAVNYCGVFPSTAVWHH